MAARASNPTTAGLVYTVAGAKAIAVERDLTYATNEGPLSFDLYRPAAKAGLSPAVIFVSGFPDPGMTRTFGKPMKDWASYAGWARMVAARGMIGLAYANRWPGDVEAFVDHVRRNAPRLGIDPARIGAWACSGNVPSALALVSRRAFACAALLYGYMLDLDGASFVAEAAARIGFAAPPVALDALPRATPMLVVRAGNDATPGLNATIDRFVLTARARGLAITLVDNPGAPHAFDVVDDSSRTRESVERVLGFLEGALGAKAPR